MGLGTPLSKHLWCTLLSWTGCLCGLDWEPYGLITNSGTGSGATWEVDAPSWPIPSLSTLPKAGPRNIFPTFLDVSSKMTFTSWESSRSLSNCDTRAISSLFYRFTTINCSLKETFTFSSWLVDASNPLKLSISHSKSVTLRVRSLFNFLVFRVSEYKYLNVI